MSNDLGFDTGGLSPAGVLNAMSSALSNASTQLANLLSNFNATDTNQVVLLQVYTEQLSALMSTTTNAIKSIYDSVNAVIRNIS